MKRQCTHTKFALNPPDEFSNLFYARIFFEISVFWSYTLYHYSKALAKRTCKLSQVDASWTCVETCVGWPNGSQASSQVHSSRKKKDILRQTILYFIANNRLMDITQLMLTWVGWPNGEKLASTCVQVWPRPKWAQAIEVNASARKPWPNEVASWSKSSTCVNLRIRLARALVLAFCFAKYLALFRFST